MLIGLRKKVYQLINEGVGMIGESYKLDSYAQKLIEKVVMFQGVILIRNYYTATPVVGYAAREGDVYGQPDQEDGQQLRPLNVILYILFDNKLLVQFQLMGIPPAPREVPQVEVTHISFNIRINLKLLIQGDHWRLRVVSRSTFFTSFPD